MRLIEKLAYTVTDTIYKCIVDTGKYFCTRCKLDANIPRLPDGTLHTY